MPQFKYRASGTYVIASQGTGVGEVGYQVTVTPRESWVGSLVFKQNTAPPGSVPVYVNVAYQDANTGTEVAAGTAITDTAAIIISPTVGDLVVVYTHTTGEIVITVNPATRGVTNRELSNAFLAAGYDTAGQDTTEAMLSVAVADMLGTQLNVKAFGAVGDGVTDDTAAIQAALDTATSGGIVFFPDGIYRVTDSLVPLSSTALVGTQPEWATNADWYQSDKGSIIQCDNGTLAGEAVIDLSGKVMVAVRNLSIRIAGQDQTTNTTLAIADLTGGTYSGAFVIENNTFTGFGGAVLKIGGGVSRIVGNWMRNCNSHLIWLYNYNDGSRFGSDCTVQWNDIGSTATTGADGIRVDGGGNNQIFANQVFNCSNGVHLTNTAVFNRVEGNRCEKHGYSGIYVTGANSNGNLILGNQCYNNGSVDGLGVGIAVSGGGGTHVIGNRVFQDPSASGYEDQARGISTSGNATKVHIAGNSCALQEQYGIYVGSNNSTVVDNYVQETKLQGIAIAGAATRVSGNYVYDVGLLTDNTYDAIIFSTGADASVCENNTVRHGGGSNRARYGVRVDAGVNGIVVRNNDFYQAGRAKGISDAGTGTTFIRNRLSVGAMSGRATLVNGTVTVNTAEAQTGDSILLTRVAGAGTTRGVLSVGTIVNDVSFVINSTDLAGTLSADDDSTVFWEIVH